MYMHAYVIEKHKIYAEMEKFKQLKNKNYFNSFL